MIFFGIIEFDAKCPECGGQMARNNHYCSVKCYNVAKLSELKVDQAVVEGDGE